MRRLLAVVATAGVVAAACSGGDDDASTAAADTIAGTTTTTTTTTETTTPTTTTTTTSPAPTSAPPTSPPSTSDTPAPTTAPPTTVLPADFDAITAVVQDFVNKHRLNGAGLVVVDREDGIVHQEYWGEFTPDRVSFIASSTKMITAGVLMRLADEGLLDIDAPVADAVPWGSGNPEITPAQLVSNSSGLVGLLQNPLYPPYLCQFQPAEEIEACAEAVFTTPDDDAAVVAPDTKFRYGGVQWQVAGAVAEAVSGKPWGQLIDEIYVQPCGVESLGYNNHWIVTGNFDYPRAIDPTTQTPTENPHMEGGAYIDPLDYAELLLMHLRGGRCPNGDVMSAASIDRLHTDRTLSAYPDGAASPGYGMGWWVDRDTGRINDNGAYGSIPWLDLDAGYGAYLVLEATNSLGRELSDLIEPLIDAAMSD